MIAALDWGGSWADAVIWQNGVKGVYSIQSRETTAEELLRKTLEAKKITLEKINLVAATGGDARRVGKTLLGKPVQVLNELRCIAAGARFLSGKNKAVAVSCGTGAAVVYYDGEKTEHLGGTGVGGGTLEGLARLLLDKNVEELEALALKAEGTLDLSVQDIVGSGIGLVPGEATASNFGNVDVAKASNERIASSLLHMVAEVIATVASLASGKVGCGDLVFVGRVAKNKVFQERLKFTAQIFGKKAFFPAKGEYAAAIGAALKASD